MPYVDAYGAKLYFEESGHEDELGTVTAGKYADLVAVPGNPLDDITSVERVSFVMKGGYVFKH